MTHFWDRRGGYPAPETKWEDIPKAPLGPGPGQPEAPTHPDPHKMTQGGREPKLNVRYTIFNAFQKYYVPADGIIERIDESTDSLGDTCVCIGFWRNGSLEWIDKTGYSVYDLLMEIDE